MKGIIAAFFGAVVVACSGCGGGGGGAGAPASQASPPPQPKSVTIDAEGDSTMLGAENPGGTNQNPHAFVTQNSAPADLQAYLRAALGDNVTVENHGVSGSTACERINGTAPWYSATLAASLASESAQIVIGNWAINDADNHGSETPTQYQQCLEKFVDTVRAAGKTAILEEPNPVVGATYYPSDPGAYDTLPNYVSVMRAVAQEKGVLLIEQYDYIQTLQGWQSMLTDGVHPGDALYAIKAQREADALSSLVKALQ